jgi:hypothetical protein
MPQRHNSTSKVKEKKIMSKIAKYSAALLLVLLASMILLPTLNLTFAQDEEEPLFPGFPVIPDQAQVIIATTVGGTTTPAPGAYVYPNQTKFEIKAIPDEGYRFAYWSISGEYLPGHNMPQVFIPVGDEEFIPSLQQQAINVQYDSLITTQNPLDVVHGYGYTFLYQAIFVAVTPVTAPVSGGVVVLEAVGGTSSPQPGMYSYATDAVVTLTATPSEGFEFKYWVISGGPLPGHSDVEDGVVTENPLTTHAVSGESYNYQPVFTAVGAGPATTGIPVEYLVAIVVLVIIAVIGLGLALMYRGKAKK